MKNEIKQETDYTLLIRRIGRFFISSTVFFEFVDQKKNKINRIILAIYSDVFSHKFILSLRIYVFTDIYESPYTSYCLNSDNAPFLWCLL